MSLGSPMGSVLESLRENATVRTVYGEPITEYGRTVVPVARVRYGFGGGYGSGSASGDDGGESFVEGEGDAVGEGGGVGGGVSVTPVGMVELSATGTRFVRFGDRRRLAAGAAAGLLAGVALDRALGRLRPAATPDDRSAAPDPHEEDRRGRPGRMRTGVRRRLGRN